MIAIVTHNNLHLSRKAIASARKQEPVPIEVLVVDNASTDGTQQWLLSQPVNTIHLHKQRSLAACWNMAAKIAFAAGDDKILILNNDVEIRPDTYWKMCYWCNSLKTPKPILTCRSVKTWGEMNVDVNVYELLGSSLPHPDFSCFMLHKSTYHQVGPFDEAYYPAYCEDCDYHVRMHRAGIDALSLDIPFLHHGAQTLKNADPAELCMIQRGAELNRQRFKDLYGCLPGTEEYRMLFEQSDEKEKEK